MTTHSPGSSVPKGRLEEVAAACIDPNPSQPRRRFSQKRIEALARSMRGQGVLQPLVVRPHPEDFRRYQLVAGERRLRAARLLGWDHVPVLIREVPDEHLLEAALVENLQREQLTPIEEAGAYRDLLHKYGYTQETLAGRVGKDRSTIANMVRLLSLPPSLQDDLEEGRLTAGHARALLAVAEPDHQVALRDRVLDRGLSVRETERLIRKSRFRPPPAAREESPATAPSRKEELQFEATREMLEQRIGSRIAIHRNGGPGEKSGGRIEIEFYSMDDFNRIYELLIR